MSKYLIRNSNGFSFGYSPITKIGELDNDTGINFGILKLRCGEEKLITSHLETACLLIQGKCEFISDHQSYIVARHSCFDEDPCALHCAAEHPVTIKAMTDCEFAVTQVKNSNDFPTQIYTSANMIESEKRGDGLLSNTACRIVRTIFDIRNSPHSKLVLGEVIAAPGRWSSYPPHHHAQPEIYHYRFTEPQGYGHAECGEEVFKVKQFDTYKILNKNDHAQAAAPGYGMYYIWVIRHLDNNPYHLPEFTEDHYWTKTLEANIRVWKGLF